MSSVSHPCAVDKIVDLQPVACYILEMVQNKDVVPMKS